MFGGFDYFAYGNPLNDGVMAPIRAHTNLRWIGFYLAHGYAGPGSTWTARQPTRAPLVSTWRYFRAEGWGRAPIFLGRQFVGGAANPGWNEQNGRADGRYAVALATKNDAAHLVDIELGATIYLDLEADGFMAVPSAVNYLSGWFAEVAAAGYRPGAYCFRTFDAPEIHKKFPDVFIWFIDLRWAQVGAGQSGAYNDQTGILKLPPKSAYQDSNWLATQFAQYHSPLPVTGAKLKTGAATWCNVSPIDFDAALVPDPAHPEDNFAITFAPFRPGQPAALFLTSDFLWYQFLEPGVQWGDWSGGALRVSETPIVDLGYGKWFDTASVAAASRQPGLIDVFGLGIDGRLWTTWRSADVPASAGQPAKDGEWAPQAQILNPNMPARLGCAVAAVSRKTDVLDVFFINRNHELTNTWWTPLDTNWETHTGPITHDFAFAPATNIAALTSPSDTERIDLFAIDWSNNIRWVQWRAGQPWQTKMIPGVTSADPAVGVHGVWHGGSIHLICGTRDGSIVHLRHPDGNMSNATGWIFHGFVPALVPMIRPMGLGLCSVGDHLIVVGVASNALLFWAGWNGGVWVPGGHADTPAYSTSGRIAITRFDASSLDVILPNQQEPVVRRLTVTSPVGPVVSLTGSWKWGIA